MLSERVSLVVSSRADHTVQLGIAEPEGVGIMGNPTFRTREALATALERSGLPSELAWQLASHQRGE